jgi:pyruvate kinase
MPLEQVPRVQKRIIRAARAVGRPSIVATQVLESMRKDPRPTRAEVSDAANAVDEGADAIMLAGETAAGEHPVKSVETLAAIIRDAELMPTAERVVLMPDPVSVHGRALGEAALTLATTAQATAIVAVTHEGQTARLLSALRPSATIYAATGSERVAGTLTLLRGVVPIVTGERDPERLERILLDQRILPIGTVVVFINVSGELDRIDANFLNVQRLG